MSPNWIDLRQEPDTGIETLRAHFQGHAYDPHWHDSYLVGVTEQGVQQFTCRRARHQSTPGKVFLLEPGELHDGHAPTPGGFTYSMLYLDPHWIERELRTQGWWDEIPPSAEALSSVEPFSVDTLDFEQWLQWIFLPRMKMILEQDLPLPNASGIQEMAEMVFAQRNLQGKDRQLQVLLKEFDLLITASR